MKLHVVLQSLRTRRRFLVTEVDLTAWDDFQYDCTGEPYDLVAPLDKRQADVIVAMLGVFSWGPEYRLEMTPR